MPNNKKDPRQADGVSVFCSLAVVIDRGTVDEEDLPAVRREGIVPQPFQPYNFYLRLCRAKFFVAIPAEPFHV